jgi:hypothetical protein
MEVSMTFDILSAIEATASAAAVVLVLSFVLARGDRHRVRVAAILLAWFAAVVVLGATRILDAEQGLGVPGLGAAIVLPVAVLLGALFVADSVRNALFAAPLPLLIGLHSVRVFGVSFVLLYLANRLPAPFAPVAGWGDILVGLTAAPLAGLAWRRGEQARPLVLAWNSLGLLDLVAAVGLGATSSPGPLRLFLTAPDSTLMTTLPWIIIPCFLVPCLMFIHVAIFYRLGTPEGRRQIAVQHR